MNSWVIYVGGGYGAFIFEGSEQEAEEMRVHKARWERAVAAKRPADLKEINSKQPSLCWNHKGFGFKAPHACECGECCEDCGASAGFDGMWHKPSCPSL